MIKDKIYAIVAVITLLTFASCETMNANLAEGANAGIQYHVRVPAMQAQSLTALSNKIYAENELKDSTNVWIETLDIRLCAQKDSAVIRLKNISFSRSGNKLSFGNFQQPDLPHFRYTGPVTTSLHGDYRVANKVETQHVSATYRGNAAGIDEITKPMPGN
ncbi:MAG TPA: hypothetical protein VJ844_03895 [Mucilaginibacter sp.]|nr:hypothetical protein [Mucilaginibacter sp.]